MPAAVAQPLPSILHHFYIIAPDVARSPTGVRCSSFLPCRFPCRPARGGQNICERRPAGRAEERAAGGVHRQSPPHLRLCRGHLPRQRPHATSHCVRAHEPRGPGCQGAVRRGAQARVTSSSCTNRCRHAGTSRAWTASATARHHADIQHLFSTSPPTSCHSAGRHCRMAPLHSRPLRSCAWPASCGS